MERSKLTLDDLPIFFRFVLIKVSSMTSNSKRSVLPFFTVRQTPFTETLAPLDKFLAKPLGALMTKET